MMLYHPWNSKKEIALVMLIGIVVGVCLGVLICMLNPHWINTPENHPIYKKAIVFLEEAESKITNLHHKVDLLAKKNEYLMQSHQDYQHRALEAENRYSMDCVPQKEADQEIGRLEAQLMKCLRDKRTILEELAK